jgi:flagellar biosynthesis protein FlhG
MRDQAQNLRELVKFQGSDSSSSSVPIPPKHTRVITVTSGKGGVGKSNFTLNFALALKAKGKKVIVFDADIGLANIDVLMGISPKYNLYHLVRQEKNIWEIIQKGVNDIEFVAGGSGFKELMHLKDEELTYFTEQMEQLNGYADYILFDTGAGLSKETLHFIMAAHEVIVVTTPEPTAITDAYAIIKMVHTMKNDVSFQIVVNRSMDTKEGKQTADKITMVARQFLKMDIKTLGFVPDDPIVTKAVKKQVPFTSLYPYSQATKGIYHLVDLFLDNQSEHSSSKENGLKGFLQKMVNYLR